MNRLWVRLSLAFAAIVVLAFSTVVFTATSLVSTQRIQTYIAEELEQPNGLRDLVAAYYRAQGEWDGVELLLMGADAMLVYGPATRSAHFAILSNQGNVLYTGELDNNEVPPPSQPVLTTPITVDGVQVGQLAVMVPSTSEDRPLIDVLLPPFAQNGVPGLLREFSRFLLGVSGLGAVLGLIFGIAVSRGLTAPLARLATAANAIGAGDWTYRVSENGSEELRAVAQSFNEMAAALESAETLRQNMLADIAHELRTPLTVLQGNLRAMLDGVYPLEAGEIARLYDQTRHLHRLVEDLHTLAQAEANQLPLQRLRFDLAEMATETTAFFTAAAEDAGVHLTTITDDGPVYVNGDRWRLNQVLQNLLTNAIRHTPAEGTVVVKTDETDGEVVLSVTDSGDGIDPAQIGRVFERFYRVDKARSRDAGGAGLGLAIARALVEAHGGRIEVQSAGIGKGSLFRVCLPKA
ncbi:HAMP domain-containing protein [bacterium]|nr:HAMP domain-containing protein [bacterium]